MKHAKILSTLLLAILIIISSNACSKGKSPVEPVIDNAPDISQDTPSSFGTESDNRNVLCVYDCVIDPVTKTFTIEPANRSADYHFPLTQLYPNVLQITGYGWTPNFWADIKLVHPFPGSGIDGFDPRVIAILPANPGVSMNYPELYVFANNSVLLNPDGYTRLHDILNVVGNANPFVAYFKDQPYRVWSSFYATQETKRWDMDISGFGGPISFSLVVDVSTHFPSVPQHIVDNAPEPVQLDIEVSGGLRDNGGTADVEVTVLDWQGLSSIGAVAVEAPDFFTGIVNLEYSDTGPEPNEYIFRGTISNDYLAPSGEYNILFAAWDHQTGIYIYDETKVTVDEEIILNPIDITPVNFDGYAYSVYISLGYAYVATFEYGLQIIDIDPPESAYLINTIETIGITNDVHVYGDYAYVTSGYSRLDIVAINPPESAYIVSSVDTPGAQGVYISNGYAYVAAGGYNRGLQIIDIDPPESAYIVNSVDTPGSAVDVYISNGYAYVADYGSGLQIVDIDPPESAYIISSIVTPEGGYDISVSDDYAYVADGGSGLQIIDILSPDFPFHVSSLNTPGSAVGVYISNGYAYIADYGSGLQIVDIARPSYPHIVGGLNTHGNANNVYVSDGYAYIADGEDGLRIIDLW